MLHVMLYDFNDAVELEEQEVRKTSITVVIMIDYCTSFGS